FFFPSHAHHPLLHSFPTRRSSDLERRKEYVDAAVALAFSNMRIIFRHLLPNCLPPLLVLATVQIAAAITLEATLSFLGLGLPIRSEEHTSELQSLRHLVCRLLLEK